MRLVERPASLDLKWTEEDRRIFISANDTWEAWHSWLQTHEPTDDQIYRKLLLDLFFDYGKARHLGADFDTLHPFYDEFNRCTGEPIRSMEDYVDRIRVLLDYEMDNRLTSPRDLALAKLAFMVSGDPAKPPPPETSVASEGDHILFYRVDEPYGFMSNFARYPIQLDGREWPTSEHYFQAQKFAGRAEEEHVRAARSAREAARLGRTLPGLRGDWDAVKDEVMLKALRAKFAQHAELRAQLVGTGGRCLVEHTTNDAYWADGGDGSGRNRLGELLMQVRDDLR